MEQVVLKPQNLPEQLRILASDLGKECSVQEQLEEASKQDALVGRILDAVRQDTSMREITMAECSEIGGQLYYRGKRYVPDSPEIQLRLIKDHHDTPLAGHPGRSKTFELLSRHYYWKTMRKQVDRYVRNCAECQKSRTGRHTSFGVLRPLPVPETPWEGISMDFVTGLPECEGYDAIWVVVDRLSKMRHFVPCRTTIDARGLAEMFLKDVVRLHGLPKTIISDRGPQFAAVFWKRLCERLGVDRRLSMAFHPQTDGQTERMNASMEQYLRIYTSHQQDDWVQWLPLAEFAANNAMSEATKCSAFFAVSGTDPRMTFEEAASEPADSRMVDADSVQTAMQQVHEHIRVEMRRSQDIMEEGANRKRLPAPQIQEGSKVWLDARHIRTTRPSRKLDWKRLGPYTVISLLDPVAEGPLPGQVVTPPRPVEVEGDQEYQVERVEDSRIYRNQLQYLVRWT
jgi:transposase InsO family protein